MMKLFAVLAMAAVSLAGPAGAQTAIQAGLWETNDKTTMEGVQPMPATWQRHRFHDRGAARQRSEHRITHGSTIFLYSEATSLS